MSALPEQDRPRTKEEAKASFDDMRRRLQGVTVSNEEHDRWQERQDAERCEHATKMASFPQRHLANAKDLRHEPEWTDARARLTKRIGTGFMVALLGNVGTGKTQLAVCIGLEAIRRKITVRYTTGPGLMIEIQKARSFSAKTTFAGLTYALINTGLLIVDEVGRTSMGDADSCILYHVIDERYQRRRDTLFVGNVTSDDFEQRLGPSVASRIVEAGGVIELSCRSFREPMDEEGEDA